MKQSDFWASVFKRAKKQYRRRFKKTISEKEIREIIYNWVNGVKNTVVSEGKFQMDKHSFIEVVGVPIMNDKRFFNLLLQGKTINRKGELKSANLHSRRKEFKYRITYQNSINSGLRFRAHPSFSKQIRESLINTNNYYRINVS